MKDLLAKTLEPNPMKRITSAELWSIIDGLRNSAAIPKNIDTDRSEKEMAIEAS